MLKRFVPALLLALAVASGPASCARHAAPATTPAATPPPAPAPAAPAAAAPAAPRAVPDRLTDQEFWTLVNESSEPDGIFRSDNLLSNETWFQYVIPELTRVAKSGRAYMGVGPEQNFTYIAALHPAIAFIVDVRRGNLDLQLMYKALFEMSRDRVEFAARLFSRKRPDLPPDADVKTIFAALADTPPDEAMLTENLHSIVDHLTKTHGFALTPADLAGIDMVARTFNYYGTTLTYWMSGGMGGGRFGRNSPSYADLMVATDEAGIARSYLASDESFATLKHLEERNLLVPVIGNFAGPKAIRAVGSYLRAHNALVSAFYLSNVEQYLNMDGIWMDFCGNVATLPLDESSTFIRAVRDAQYGYGYGLRSRLDRIQDDIKACAQSQVPHGSVGARSPGG